MAELQQIEVPAFWQEIDPDSLLLCQHIGELDVGDGRKWAITGSLNGMNLYVKTDLPAETEHGIKERRFQVCGSGLIQALARSLL